MQRLSPFVVVTLVTLIPTVGFTQEDGSSARASDPLLISGTLGSVGMGIEAVWNLTPNLALEARAGSFVLLSSAGAGVRWYVLDSRVSPFVSLSSLTITRIGEAAEYGVLGSGGVEWTSEGGFTASGTGGLMAMFDDIAARTPYLAFGLGARF